ncbi:hypothetical protein RclHR1_07090001 [Rhizophagus clarus]|uniref:Actin-like ATPase domain-containing protein n=1 Tax=Rhizophagus clarus TaxID=94130 RepID=A0A2Z6SBY8_9GLOM|nr:hypothetical protein RclHR1_07090001 [Rhizophagus clarus]GES81579.1 hypothetical protein GLOIN_2v1783276 [Rhizophagus clarus]
MPESLTATMQCVRVVVDFGTTFSRFSYSNIFSRDCMVTNDQWPEHCGQLKTNTVLQYDQDFNKVLKWGAPALFRRRSRRDESRETKVVELFKLCLGNLEENLKPKLPIDYKKAITDYLTEFGKVIKTKIEASCNLNFLKEVLFVFAVPEEYSENEKATMRECIYNAKLISEKDSNLLQFATKSEAAAIYCMKHYLEDDTGIEETTLMIVDCGDGIVDLIIRKIVGNDVGKLTERSSDYCGGSFVDQAYLEHLKKILGHSAIDNLKEKNPRQLQYIIKKFGRQAKFLFTGDDKNFTYALDIIDTAHDLQKYVTGDAETMMDENEWLIQFNYNEIKSMFDPIIERILKLIELQLENSSKKCSIMFLVGEFCQSIYLQKRIKEKFNDLVKNISVPKHHVAIVARGATLYGLLLYDKINNNSYGEEGLKLTTRVLKFTYGIKIIDTWKKSDPPERKSPKGEISRFFPIGKAKRGNSVNIDEFIFADKELGPSNPFQTMAIFHVYYTRECDAKYCDEPGMKYLGKLKINLLDVHLGLNKHLKFGLSFGEMEIKATARNATNRQCYLTTFEMNEIENEEDN